MTVTLNIVDPSDETTVLFSMQDASGTYAPAYGATKVEVSGLNPDLGTPRLQSTEVTPQDIDATYSAFSKRATADMKLKLIITASSYDNLSLACGTLSQYLTQGCVMKYSAGTNVFLIDVLPSPTPGLIAGQELAFHRAGVQFQTDVELTLLRQPYFRQSGLTPATNTLSNSTPLRDSDADGTPDSWTKVSTPTLTIAPTTQSLHVVAGAATRGVYQATGAASASAAQVWTLSADVKVTSGTAALRLDWRTAAAANISNSDQTTTTATWARVSVTGTAPATTDHIRATLISSGAAATFDVRNVQLELASTATSYRVAAETVNLDPATAGFSKMLPVWNPGTAPAPMTITTKFPDSNSNVEAMDFWLATTDNIAGNHYLSDYLNGPYYAQAERSANGWTLTAGTDTTLLGATDASASPGSGTAVARITHSTDPTTFNTRITFTRSTFLDALRGTHRVFARVKPAAAKKYRLQLSWSAGTLTTETNDEFLLDATLNTSNVYALCDLGTIDIPTSSAVTMANLTLELSSRMGLGTSASNLDVDYIMLVPQTNSAHVIATEAETVTSVTTQGADMQVPKDLGAGDPTWTAGTATGTAVRLNVLNQAAGIGSTSTGAYTGQAGATHGFITQVQENNFIGTYNIEVANLTDNTVVSTQAYTRATASNFGLGFGNHFADTAGKVYQPRVTLTSYTSGNIKVLSIAVRAISTIAQNQQIRTDPGSTGPDRYAVERLDSSSFYVGALDADRVPFWIPPGLSLLWVESYDASVGGEELPHINARTLTVTPTVYPRHWA